MRVTVTTVEDFCAELSREAAAGCVLRSTVRTRIDRGAEQDEEVSWTVALWATAVIRSPECDYLLEYAEICGSDDPQNDPPDAGTRCARAKQATIRAVAEASNLLFLPGKYEAP